MDKLGIAVDLGGTNIRGAVIGDSGTLFDQMSQLTPVEEGRDAVINKIFMVIDRLKDQYPQVVGVGIGSPGIIDYQTGDIIGAGPNIRDWVGTPLGRLLKERYHLPVKVENDVNAITLGEYYYGKKDLPKNFACIGLGTGVGIGIVIDKKIFSHAHELGHMIVNCSYEGHVCGCGRPGCLESFTSGSWISKNYLRFMREEGNALVDEKILASTIFHNSSNGDKHAKRAVSIFISALGSAIANIVLAYSITDFVITGGVAHSFDVFAEDLLKEVYRRSISHLNDQIQIRKGTLGDNAGLFGGAVLVFEKFLD